jgi:hypothetical protein
MKFNKPEFTAFRSDFASAVKSLETKYGVKIALKTITYTDVSFTSKIVVSNVGENGAPEVDTESFMWAARALGVPETWLNTEFRTPRGERLRITGLNPRRPKNAVELYGIESGKSYKATVGYVRMFVK